MMIPANAIASPTTAEMTHSSGSQLRRSHLPAAHAAENAHAIDRVNNVARACALPVLGVPQRLCVGRWAGGQVGRWAGRGVGFEQSPAFDSKSPLGFFSFCRSAYQERNKQSMKYESDR